MISLQGIIWCGHWRKGVLLKEITHKNQFTEGGVHYFMRTAMSPGPPVTDDQAQFLAIGLVEGPTPIDFQRADTVFIKNWTEYRDYNPPLTRKLIPGWTTQQDTNPSPNEDLPNRLGGLTGPFTLTAKGTISGLLLAGITSEELMSTVDLEEDLEVIPGDIIRVIWQVNLLSNVSSSATKDELDHTLELV